MPTTSCATPPGRVPSSGSRTGSHLEPELAHTSRQPHTGARPQLRKSPAARGGCSRPHPTRPRPPPARARLARRAPLGRSSGPATLTRRSPSHGRPPPQPRRPAAAPQSWPRRPSVRSPTLVVLVVAAATTAAPEAREHREAPPTRPAPAPGALEAPPTPARRQHSPHPPTQHAAEAPPTARAGGPPPRPLAPTPPAACAGCPAHTLHPHTRGLPEAPPTPSAYARIARRRPHPHARPPPSVCVSACSGPRARNRALTSGSAWRSPRLPFPYFVPRKWVTR